MRKITTFLLVGLSTAAIYFFIFTVAWKWLHIDYRIAVSAAFAISVIFQFISNRQLTFKSYHSNITYQTVKFIIMLVINYILTLLIVTGAVTLLSVSPYIGIILSVGVTVISGFLLSNFWVFKEASCVISSPAAPASSAAT